MARILTVAGEFPSVLYPMAELARRLSASGHEVTLAAPADSGPLAQDLGLGFQALEPSSVDAFFEDDGCRGLAERVRHASERGRRGVAALGVDGFGARLREDPPDLVIVDGEMHAHVIAAAGAGVDVALVNTFAAIWRRPGLPPPHHRATPGVGWRGTRAGMSLLWGELVLRKRLRALRARWRRLGCDRVSLLRQLAAREGFDFLGETDDTQWLIPFTYRRLPVLSVHARELEFPHEPPERVRYVGPMILETRTDRVMSELDRARLETVLRRRETSSGDARLIYAAFGSTGTVAAGLLQKLASAVIDTPSWELIVSVGGRGREEALGPPHERVHPFAWTPQLEVLRHADAAVTHGGIHTIDECISRGVPMLVYCGAETDMAGNTERVVYHGIGVAGNARDDDAAAVGGRLRAVLDDPRLRERLAVLRAAFAAYASARAAERAVEALLESAG